MSVLSTIAAILRDISARGAATLEAMVESIRSVCFGDRETRRRVAFSVAMIALSAKMARADGVVTQTEITAFRRIFDIPPDEVRNVFRLYDLARQDTAGFEAYAMQMRQLCDGEAGECLLLEDVLDGLFFIAGADGSIHDREIEFLEAVSRAFALAPGRFETILARHAGPAGAAKAYAVLGVAPDAPPEVKRRRYLELVRENHPDRLAARGVPQEFMAIATERMKAINAAWASVSKASAA